MSTPSNALSNAIAQQQAQETQLVDEYGQPLNTPQDWSIGYTPPSNMGIETPVTSPRPNAVSDSPTPDQLVTSPELKRDQQAMSSASGLFGQFETWLTSSSVNIVAVLIGLVLIAGAVWGFDQVRETVVSTAKGAAELAA